MDENMNKENQLVQRFMETHEIPGSPAVGIGQASNGKDLAIYVHFKTKKEMKKFFQNQLPSATFEGMEVRGIVVGTVRVRPLKG